MNDRARSRIGSTISVITPSLNMLPYLKRCCASLADQEGASRDHIVVDGESTDGTVGMVT
jgi:glycosyltransferase involved in cell wall biosynthesis